MDLVLRVFPSHPPNSPGPLPHSPPVIMLAQIPPKLLHSDCLKMVLTVVRL